MSNKSVLNLNFDLQFDKIVKIEFSHVVGASFYGLNFMKYICALQGTLENKIGILLVIIIIISICIAPLPGIKPSPTDAFLLVLDFMHQEIYPPFSF